MAAARGVATGRLARARIIPPSQLNLFGEAPSEELARVLRPGVSVEWYRRMWHVGQVEIRDDILLSRLGFESYLLRDLWDPGRLDFEEEDVPNGMASPFAVRLSDLAVVFQPRGSNLGIQTFTSAFKALIRSLTGDADWDVQLVARPATFAEWRSSITRVVRIRGRLLPPNPHYEGRPYVEQLLDTAQLTVANLDLRAEDLDTDASAIRQILDHIERGYGTGTAMGEKVVDGQVIESVYDIADRDASDLTPRPVDATTGEVDRNSLWEELVVLDSGEGQRQG